MPMQKKQRIIIIVLAAGILLALWGASAGRGWMMALGVGGIMAGLVLDVVLLRCPHCGAWLGRYPGEYCRSCGGKIPWKDEK